MEEKATNLIMLLLPEHLKEVGSKLIQVSRADDEERRRERHRKSQRSHRHEETEEDKDKRKKKQEMAAIPLAIGRLVMELWSKEMRQHAEKLILQKAVEEGYLKQNHLKWVHILEEEEEMTTPKEWVILNQNEAIIELVWEMFDIKTHYSQVHSHRMWIQRSYDRLKSFIPSLPAEIVERHDLSKFAFSQAIGYALKWVHNTYHSIWKTACDLHLFNEPHHPQTWSKAHTPEQKHQILAKWLYFSSDCHTGCPYGLDVANIDMSTEDFPEPFLMESYIDMVGVEWERRKGMDLNISTRHLAYIEDKFLVRYTKKQFQVIRNLITHIVASDETCKDVALTDREVTLLKTLPEHKRGLYITQVEQQKKIEEKRMTKVGFKNPMQESEVKVSLTDEGKRKAQNKCFYIMVANVALDHWDTKLRRRIEDLILKKAIEEKQIKSSYVKWIRVFEDKDDKTEITLSEDPSTMSVPEKEIVDLLWYDFKLKEHFTQVQQHRHWIRRSYLHLASFMPELSEEIIERHDLTKLSLSQGLGYTLKWVHDINYPVWRRACEIHLNYEPHHPQMWSNKNGVEHKIKCLENWLSARAKDSTCGVVISTLDLTSENMAKAFLLESLVDMVAVEWERNKDQKPDLTYTQLIHMEDRFLNRYTDSDRAYILRLMDVIRKTDRMLSAI